MMAASPPPQGPSIAPVSGDHLPEPQAAVTDAADEIEMPLPSDPQLDFPLSSVTPAQCHPCRVHALHRWTGRCSAPLQMDRDH